jgi:hypothetical protein
VNKPYRGNFYFVCPKSKIRLVIIANFSKARKKSKLKNEKDWFVGHGEIFLLS